MMLGVGKTKQLREREANSVVSSDSKGIPREIRALGGYLSQGFWEK